MQLGRAAFWIAVYLGLVLAPLFVLLVGTTETNAGFWWHFAIALGFAGTAMMGVQFMLTARFKRAMAPFGIDIIYYFHRYIAVVALGLIVAHPVILVSDNPAVLGFLNPVRAPWQMTAGLASILALTALMISCGGANAWACTMTHGDAGTALSPSRRWGWRSRTSAAWVTTSRLPGSEHCGPGLAFRGLEWLPTCASGNRGGRCAGPMTWWTSGQSAAMRGQSSSDLAATKGSVIIRDSSPG